MTIAVRPASDGEEIQHENRVYLPAPIRMLGYVFLRGILPSIIAGKIFLFYRCCSYGRWDEVTAKVACQVGRIAETVYPEAGVALR